ncbi:uncharacterized protein E0L32_007681 [Thyridium curvatum]|uniref:RTA1-like protein n=1 Tax=Thyridium curvatum TaxID=1093900 RepID=A0A507AP67_9PEZI|nr:uncharacterized protein E0L32_007681 [Thyridium curvatum]TPX11702.1 hypothetical protein E0L32_007681 [Thyridium curvatum]
MAVLEPYKGKYFLWKYLPSIPAAGVFCGLFAIITVLNCWRVGRTGTWSFIPFIIGGFMECIGYATRAVAYNQTGKLVPFALQNSMILLAPVLLAATIYATLGRVISGVNADKYAIVRPRWITRLFVTGDILSLLVQGSAAGLMLMEGRMKTGQNIVILGLVIQILLFGLFCLTAALFHVRMRRCPTEGHRSGGEEWERQIYRLYGVSALVMFRSVFRLVEFIMGYNAYLLTHEWPLYVFDSAPMLAVMIIFWFALPGTVWMRRPGSKDSVTSLSVLNGRTRATKGSGITGSKAAGSV